MTEDDVMLDEEAEGRDDSGTDDVGADDSGRDVATLVAGGLLGAALGAGLGLLLSRAAAPPPPAVVARRFVARGRGELDDFAERVERELRSLRRLVKRQRRRGWLR